MIDLERDLMCVVKKYIRTVERLFATEEALAMSREQVRSLSSVVEEQRRINGFLLEKIIESKRLSNHQEVFDIGMAGNEKSTGGGIM
jgi:hypothetical protein